MNNDNDNETMIQIVKDISKRITDRCSYIEYEIANELVDHHYNKMLYETFVNKNCYIQVATYDTYTRYFISWGTKKQPINNKALFYTTLLIMIGINIYMFCLL
jgi:hypothetical protein